MRSVRPIPVVVCLMLVSVPWMASAEWSGDPAANLVIADRSGPQVQPKIVATADGGFYISWFDNASGGYDVYLQRLDASGNELWVHNGVLVADRGYSSTQDYGLSIDTSGNALLAFRDDRGAGEEITVSKVSPDGTLLWGSAGVQVSSGADFIAAPKVAGTSDGNVVVAWTNLASGNSATDVVVQKLDPDGATLWGSGVVLTPTTDSFSTSDLRASDAGTAIVSFTVGSFPGTFHLWAQKLAAADGALLWGAGHVQVYDQVGGSLQFGNFPAFVSDDAGGAVFAWYTNSPSLQCRVQHILANGSEAFAHQGVEVSTNASRIRVGPSAAHLAATDEIVVFWTEENAVQSQFGVYGQKLDDSGARQWTDGGLEYVALGPDQIRFVTTLPFGDGAIAAWIHPQSFDNEPIVAIRVDGDGNPLWNPNLTDVATSPTESSRLVGALSTSGYAAYAWSDGGSSTGDILAQNVNGDGSLGPGALFEDGFESGDTSEWSDTVP